MLTGDISPYSKPLVEALRQESPLNEDNWPRQPVAHIDQLSIHVLPIPIHREIAQENTRKTGGWRRQFFCRVAKATISKAEICDE